MNTGIQDSFNLAWKLALVHRKLAPESLLDTYTEERVPVVAAMLNQITALLKENWEGKLGDPPPAHEGLSAWKHNGGLLQLGVNCRWSSVVVDEQRDVIEDIAGEYYAAEEDEAVDPDVYADRRLFAGDRAPDAPGLVVLKRRALDTPPVDVRATSLFKTFLAGRHTVLIFNNDAARCALIMQVLDAWHAYAVQCGIVVGSQETVPGGACARADFVLEDADGHAYNAYAFNSGCDVVVVRPDGLVGGVLRTEDGLSRYFQGVFGESNGEMDAPAKATRSR
jgi:hypothetical protein